MADTKLLIVDDEPDQRELLSGYLAGKGFNVTTAESGELALELYHSLFAPVALIDMKMPGMSGMELLIRLKEINPFIQVIVLTAFGSVEGAVKVMQAGATDYLTKPIEDLDELLIKLRNGANQNRLIVDNKVMRESMAEIFPDSEMIGESDVMHEVRRLISLFGPREATLLISGPSGTGKELVARAVHSLSPRSERRLVAINCAAFPETLLESELFGHERGAFTGADRAKPGRFELADGGTLFLDEVGEMPLSMQVKLLRVLEERCLERLGSIKSIPLDIRIIAATNRNLEQLIKAGTFREDLYYRLNVVEIKLPPLKDRGADILLLAEKFIEKNSKKLGKEIAGIDPQAAALLTAYDWPGNVRELQNIIERAIVLAQADLIRKGDLSGLSPSGSPAVSQSSIQPLAAMEKRHIETALRALDWNMSLAAEKLGIHRNTLRSKIKDYSLTREKS